MQGNRGKNPPEMSLVPSSEPQWLVEKLSAKGARLALELGDKLGLHWSQGVMRELLARAGEEVEEEIPLAKGVGADMLAPLTVFQRGEVPELKDVSFVMRRAKWEEEKRAAKYGTTQGGQQRKRKRS